MTFDQWWYDHCVKNGLHNPKRLKETAMAAWAAAIIEAARQARERSSGK